MLNLTRIFHSELDKDRFHDRVAPEPNRHETLEKAKNDIRDHLRPRIKAATVSVLGMSHAVEPRFRSQGSQRYKTCVDPAHLPPQEMDWDYGVYLPVTVWEENGPPRAMAKLYFELVESLLKDLCKEKGWTLVNGKDSCVRVQVTSWGHIDLPLYAASEQEFGRIVERAQLSGSVRKRAGDSAMETAAAAGELVDQEWDDMEHVMMATRSGEWKESDPEVVTRWFLDRVAEHGPQLRRVCCYVKAWRDHQWPTGGPSSVSMMIAVAQAFEARQRRDDLALEHAARTLAKALGGPIHEPAINEGKEDFNRLGERERAEAATKAQALAEQLQHARIRRVGEEAQALGFVTAQLGERVPNRTELVDPDRADDVRSVPARQVAAPLVPSSKAG
jgi:hypothetical protein